MLEFTNMQYMQNGETLRESVYNRPYIRFVEIMSQFEDSVSFGEGLSLSVGSISSGVLSRFRFHYASETVIGLVRRATTEETLSMAGDVNGEEPYLTPSRLNLAYDTYAGANGISLEGNPIIGAGLSGNFTITDFDSFSSYTVDFTPGSATILDDVVTVNVAGGSSGVGTLEVTKNGFTKEFNIAIGSAIIVAPVINYPSNGTLDFPVEGTVTTAGFTVSPPTADTHVSTDWQVSTNVGFTNIVLQSMADTVNLTSWQVSSTLTAGSSYFLRARYNGGSLTSAWSTVVSFGVANHPYTPTFVTAENETEETPTFVFSAFGSPVGEVHEYSDWEVRLASNNSLVWSSYGDVGNKVSVTVPLGQLQTSTNYKVRVRYYGSTLGYSDWSIFHNFSTDAEFFDFSPESVGLPYGGGFYAGNISFGGNTYALVVAPRTLGGQVSMQYYSGTNILATTSLYDGAANTAALASEGIQAAMFCDSLNINGHSDWYLPSLYEAEICYFNLKPTSEENTTTTGSNPYAVPPRGSNYTENVPSQTISTAFQKDSPESFIIGSEDDRYWTSSLNSSSQAHRFRFLYGSHIPSAYSFEFQVRAIRKVLISS